MRFLLLVLMLGLALPTQAQPNILWITVEDMSPHLGSFGDVRAVTPHLDALAEEGTRYVNAFATAPVCAPARSTLITGMYQTAIGSHNMRSKARLPDLVQPFTKYLREAGYYTTNRQKTDYNFDHPADTWHESSRTAHWRNRPNPDQPFFSIVNLNTTHESRIAQDPAYESVMASRPDARSFDLDALVLPPYYPDTPVVREAWARYYNIITMMDRQVGLILDELEADGLADNTIVLFFSDHGVGLPRGKRWLFDSGIHVPLIARIPPALRVDGQGNPGAVTDELVSFVDMAPTMLHLAGVSVPPHLQGRAFLGSNLSPERTYIYAARDRMDERYDMIRAVRDKRFKYIRYYEPYKPYFQYMNTPEKGTIMQEMRRLEAQDAMPAGLAGFMAATKPPEALYDLHADPHEMHNLAGDAHYQDVLQRMRDAHLDWVAETRDIGLLPEPSMNALQLQQDGAIFTLSKDPALVPIKRLRDVAALPQHGRASVPALIEAMADPHPAVRHWAAVGLGQFPSHKEHSLPTLLTALEDDDVVVRIAAARAAGALGKAAKALKPLTDALAHEDEWVRLRAAIALDELDEAARPALDALQSVMTDANKYVVRVANRAINDLLGTERVVP